MTVLSTQNRKFQLLKYFIHSHFEKKRLISQINSLFKKKHSHHFFFFPKIEHAIVSYQSMMVQCLSCVQLLQPHGLQPTQLPCPQDFPGKNTGVSCHFFLQGISLIQGSNQCLLHCRLFTAKPPGKAYQSTEGKYYKGPSLGLLNHVALPLIRCV